ncbi:MAG: hypothetical protein WCX65_16055 [bacterium]
MTSTQIENLLTNMGVKWDKIIKNMWSVVDPEGKIPKVIISIEPGGRTGGHIIKFVVFVCDVPVDTGIDFYKEFLKMNFKIEHGAFAMETRTEMCFIDNLEFETTDEVEFEASLRALMDAPRRFQERYDIDFYTIGNPQF